MIQQPRLLVLFALLSTSAHAQWLNYPTPGTPRTRDGKPNLTAPAPRAANGKPDLSGVWLHEQTPLAEMKRLFGNARIRVVPRPKKEDSAEVYIGEEFIGVLFLDDEDQDRSYNFQMAILENDLE